MSLPDITLSQLLLRASAAFIVLAVYGLVAVWASRRSGDHGPVHDARLTPNPFVHLDVLGIITAIFFRVTWLRDLKADARAFKQPAAGAAFTFAATPPEAPSLLLDRYDGERWASEPR